MSYSLTCRALSIIFSRTDDRFPSGQISRFDSLAESTHELELVEQAMLGRCTS